MPTDISFAKAFPPGLFLREELAARGWSGRDLAEILGRPVRMVNEILMGKKAVTPEISVALGEAFDVSPGFFLNLENSYRLHLLKRETDAEPSEIARKARLYAKLPVRELVRRGWLPKTADLEVLEAETCRLLGIESLDDEADCPASAARAEFTATQAAWLRRCLRLAAERPVAVACDPAELARRVPQLPRTLRGATGPADLPGELAALGVRTLFVPPLHGSKVDGAAFRCDGMPTVALSLRFDRIDRFWFTLFRELARLVLDEPDQIGLDVDLAGSASADKPESERRFDRQAADWLIPAESLARFLEEHREHGISRAAILAFADELGIHPGIVVGRLRQAGVLDLRQGRDLLVKVRDILPLES